jgi:elongation factor P
MGGGQMETARELKEGQNMLIDGELYKAVALVHHAGTAQQPGMVKATLKSLKTGRVIERRWNMDEVLPNVDLDRIEMQFLYADDDQAVFMHPQTFEQFSLTRSQVEQFLPFLKEGEYVPVEFYEGELVSVDMPKHVPLKVTSCGLGIKGQRESPMKEATLENGLTIMVPHFIEEGDTVVVEIRTVKYVDRQRKS